MLPRIPRRRSDVDEVLATLFSGSRIRGHGQCREVGNQGTLRSGRQFCWAPEDFYLLPLIETRSRHYASLLFGMMSLWEPNSF
jgi:hypothetical protein